MAELYALETITHKAAPAPGLRSGLPEVIRQPEGPGPLWRSLFFPRRGQRAVELAGEGSDLFRSLREAGVQFEREAGPGWLSGAADLDLVLEDRTSGRRPDRPDHIRSRLAPGGRWVVVLEKKRWIGLSGLRVLRRARREGFKTVESFFAYPALRSPRILVPLDRLEPFRYFLSLAVGVHGPRQRLLGLVARCLHAARLHRIFLPNLIVVARNAR
jgi:hypothetical protein